MLHAGILESTESCGSCMVQRSKEGKCGAVVHMKKRMFIENCLLNEDGQNKGIKSYPHILNGQLSIKLNFEMRVSFIPSASFKKFT